MCGNHIQINRQSFERGGSPPRVREPRDVCLLIGEIARITPACAGTTPGARQPALVSEDHPRVCGNHHELSRLMPSSLGSPPRVREPLDELVLHRDHAGITPACAGTTFGKTAEFIER